MSVVLQIKEVTANAINRLYGIDLQPNDILVNATKPEFEGDYTVVLFAFIKQLKKSPDALGQELGQQVINENPGLFTHFNVLKGFLTLPYQIISGYSLYKPNTPMFLLDRHPPMAKK